MSMTREDIEAVFNMASNRPTNFLLHDIDGFIRLKQMGWPALNDILSAAEHDQVWLSIDIDWLLGVITVDDINYLNDCGIHYDADYDSLYMFV